MSPNIFSKFSPSYCGDRFYPYRSIDHINIHISCRSPLHLNFVIFDYTNIQPLAQTKTSDHIRQANYKWAQFIISTVQANDNLPPISKSVFELLAFYLWKSSENQPNNFNNRGKNNNGLEEQRKCSRTERWKKKPAAEEKIFFSEFISHLL